ncbi:hypothetical protein OPV22_003211 [Ensete ventricosum]|uniref:Uncharacterized protein n=1 Tax=Ensete ventricosum TaxID=4639 RepID=A0AAV8RZY9_ENSVE|nr:hypothetical protein OPV22_003211 [Ensete ventricosum]
MPSSTFNRSPPVLSPLPLPPICNFTNVHDTLEYTSDAFTQKLECAHKIHFKYGKAGSWPIENREYWCRDPRT